MLSIFSRILKYVALFFFFKLEVLKKIWNENRVDFEESPVSDGEASLSKYLSESRAGRTNGQKSTVAFMAFRSSRVGRIINGWSFCPKRKIMPFDPCRTEDPCYPTLVNANETRPQHEK